MSNRVKELVKELQENYPDYTDEHVNDYVGFMKEEGYSNKEIDDFIEACGY